MSINFPNSPTNGQAFDVGAMTFEYNSTKARWEIVAGTTNTDISDLTDTTNVIPDDISDLTDTGGLLGSGGATVYADMAALIAATGMSNGDFGLVAANNNIYVYNGAGWYKIATVQNDSPSAITGVNGTYQLAIDGTATTITAVSTDPEGFPLTWSYSASGLGNIATVSNTDNVFTITPSTTVADAGTFTLTINATDGVNGAVSTSTSLTLEFIVTVTNSNYTTLLATAVDTSDNNNITDSSTNNHTPTLINPTDALAQGSFSPYRSGGYSTKFEPDSYFNILNQPAIGSGDCSIECWVNVSTLSHWHGIIKRGANGSAGCFQFYVRNDTELYLNWSGTQQNTSGANIQINTWHWLQVIRSSGTVTIYVDGVSRASFDGDSNIQSTTFYDIGGWTGNFSEGFIRDLRVSTVARSSSTGPSDKLEVDSDTTFLTCNSPYVTFSTPSVVNNYVQYISGPISIEPFSPYDYLEYSATDHGGSIQSTNSNDTSAGRTGLSFADHADFDLAGSDWTFEWWAYVPKSEGVNNHNFIQKGPFGAIRPYTVIYRLESGQPGWEPRMFGSSNGSSQWEGYSGSAWQPWSIWTHVAFVRNGSTITRYINGKAYGTGSGDVFDNNEVLLVGGGYGDEQPHTYSDLRISKSAVYTAEFTPPTAPLSSSGSVLHLKGANASVIDKSQINNIKMNGPTTGSTTKTFVVSEPTISFASGSNSSRYLEFDPTVLDFMEILGNPSIPFTIEGIWGWQGSTASPIFEIFQDTNNFFYFGGGPGGTQSGITTDNNLYAIFKIGGVERFKMTAGIGSYNNVGSSFKHQAITRNSSGLMQHYYDGQLRSNTITHSGSDTVSWTSPVGYIGRSDWMGIYGRYEGYIHQVRLTVGLARYTANFTPPTASLEG